MFPEITVNIYSLLNPAGLIYNLARLIIPLVFFIDCKKEPESGKTLQNPDKNPYNRVFPKFSGKAFLKNCIFTFICLAVLLFSGAVFEYTGSFFGVKTGIEPEKISATALFAFLIPVIFYAASEEVLYRLYLPEALAWFSARVKTGKKAEPSPEKETPPKESGGKTGNLPGEILSILIFALAHYQGGILPVLNALVCGTILRICLKISKSLFPGILGHGLYNFILYFSLYSMA